MESLQDDVKLYEDHVALHGGEDGMDVIREILLLAPPLLKPDGSRSLWLEVSPEHPAMLRKWALDNSCFRVVDVYRDFRGFERFVQLQLR